MNISKPTLLLLGIVIPIVGCAASNARHEVSHESATDDVIAGQRETLASSTEGMGFGPQAPRDIESAAGNNDIAFATAPASSDMSLCDIHFHKNAEHKSAEFNKYAGNGDGHGYLSGYLYSGDLSEAELKPADAEICPSEHGGLYSGDTIEVHYVYSTAKAKLGPTLESCLSESINNPQLRVEAQVHVLVNDSNALDFGELTKHGVVNGLPQATNLPDNTGTPVEYAGSTTGPGYNEKGSPFEVSWSVRPKVSKVDIATVGEWCKGNVFEENHGHGVRNLVVNPDLLSKIN